MAKKYIDADKLITEIERLQHLNECYKRNWRWKFKWFSRTVIGRMEVLEGIKNLITSLQQEQPEVGLEKKFTFPKFLFARTLDNKTIDISYAPQSIEVVEYVRNDFIEQEQESVDKVDNTKYEDYR